MINFPGYNEQNLIKINKFSLIKYEMEEKYQFLNEDLPKHCFLNSNTAKSNHSIILITINPINMLI